MKIDLKILKLYCKKDVEELEFGERLTFIHGEMSSGKSTVVELIDYCFGGHLVRTPAISSELIKVELLAQVESTAVILERSPSIVSSIDVAWQSEDETGRETLPLAARRQPVIPPSVFNFSDFIFSCLGLPVVRVRKRTSDSESDVVRLGFRDILEFIYLNQRELDSGFFLLEQPVRAEKSKDALAFVLGLHSDHLSDLETERANLRQEQRAKREAAERISQFLEKYDFADVTKIAAEIDVLADEGADLEEKLGSIARPELPAEPLVVEMVRRLEALTAELEGVSAAADETVRRISEQQALRAELLSMKFKVARSSAATEILANASFESCPACGSALSTKVEPNHCFLCCTELSEKGQATSIPLEVMNQDLSDRIDELQSSIERLEDGLREQTRKRAIFQAELRDEQERYSEARRAIESEFMRRTRDNEVRRAQIGERIRFLQKVKEMPSEVEEIWKEADEMGVRIGELRRLIEQEEARLAQGAVNVRLVEKNMLDTLVAIGFPGVGVDDVVKINPSTWFPFVYSGSRPSEGWTFYDAGSGGKMVLFKIAYALAIHRTAAQRNLPLPHLLVIDSTMKNIATEINPEIFAAFYEHLYALMEAELGDWQVVVVDQTYKAPPATMTGVVSFKFTQNDPEHPPLIRYYRGP